MRTLPVSDHGHGSVRLKILIAADEPDNGRLMAEIIIAAGHRAIGSGDGREVLDMYERHQPDLVLLDLAMSGLAARDSVSRLRRIDPARWVPIWFVTDGDHEHEIVAAMSAGADVHIPTPVNVPVFQAQLANLARRVRVQHQMRIQNAELNAYFEASEEENRAARDIMKKLLQMQSEHGAVLRLWNSPAFKFSGDIVMAERSPDGSLKVLLADGVGHGLSAALNVLPLGRAFQAMAHKGFGLPAMVAELNLTIRRDLPSHRFVAATLVNVDVIENRIEVWNGGNPACLLLDRHGTVLRRWVSRNLPLGVLPSEEIDAQPECHAFRADAQIVMYSDGVVESANDAGTMFLEAGVVSALGGASAEERFDALKIAIVEHLAGSSAADDITVALIDCAAEMQRRAARGMNMTLPQLMLQAPTAAASGEWELRLRIGAERLKRIEIIPILQEFMSRFDPVGALDKSTFIVLSELFNNALEHGLLELDSRIKEEDNGTQRYAFERESRLAALVEGAILLDIARLESGDGAKIRVRVKDSGKGFDAQAWHVDADARSCRSDRGVGLVEQLCESVEYRDGGTEVEVLRALPPMMALV